MPYSFTKIEKDKTRTIGFVFSFLVFIYFASFWLIYLVTKSFILLESSRFNSQQSISFRFPGITESITILFIALVIGFLHWSYSTSDLIKRMLIILKAEDLNPQDSYHKVFRNILDEVAVATGGGYFKGVVIPTFAMNAFALVNKEGQAVIGVTEGLLSRLSRAQLEAVVGHEAAHIVSGDCLTTTITTSIFGLYNGILSTIKSTMFGGESTIRIRTSLPYAVLLIYGLIAVTRFMAKLFHLFISRQREYRADAIAVRLTRDPLSLAEALYSINYHWRGVGLPSEELEAIFTVNPNYSKSNDGIDLWSDWFSTHPPMDKRLKILIDMAHADLKTVCDKIIDKPEAQRISAPDLPVEGKKWMARQEGSWQGPFGISDLMNFGWIRPDTWIKEVSGEKIIRINEEDDVRKFVIDQYHLRGDTSCPRCHIPLHSIIYEGVQVEKCILCKGTLANERDVEKIVIRQEVGFSDKVVRLGEQIKKAQTDFANHQPKMNPAELYPCPKCVDFPRRMLKTFYTLAYNVEVDKCIYCHTIWFDQDELEVLQYLIENKRSQS